MPAQHFRETCVMVQDSCECKLWTRLLWVFSIVSEECLYCPHILINYCLHGRFIVQYVDMESKLNPFLNTELQWIIYTAIYPAFNMNNKFHKSTSTRMRKSWLEAIKTASCVPKFKSVIYTSWESVVYFVKAFFNHGECPKKLLPSLAPVGNFIEIELS